MSDEANDDALEKIMSDFNSEMTQQDESSDKIESSDDKRGLSKEEIEELSKEEIAEKYDLRFGQTASGDTQHLVPADEDSTYCRLSVSDGFRTSEEPGPFTPICSRCKVNALGGNGNSAGTHSNNTKADLIRWLANEVDQVEEPNLDSNGMPTGLRKPELQAIVLHIESLKENN